ncbi:MAG: hypothetical protein NW207_03535 [Cytophagales bacterium]|nr:hypothetical protein [Cytophagales bacterium]
MLKISPATVFTYLLFIPLIITYHFYEDIKQIFYLLAPLSIALILCIYLYDHKKRDINLHYGILQTLALYFLACAISLFFNFQDIYWFTAVRDMIIISSPLLIFMVRYEFVNHHIIALFITSFICYLIWIQFKIEFIHIKSLFESNYDWRHEYDYGTIVGPFILYFLYKKDYKMLLLSLLFLLLVNKRATFMGLLPAFFTYYVIIKFFKIDENKNVLIAFLMFYYFSFYIISINLPFFASMFLGLFGKGEILLDNFLTGRVIMINELQPELYNRGPVAYLFGNGVGQADYYLWKVIKNPVYNFYVKPVNPHNDYLKLHFDVGLLGVVVYFFMAYYMYVHNSGLGILMFLYTIPLLLIDNGLIYYFNLIVTCIISRADNDGKT